MRNAFRYLCLLAIALPAHSAEADTIGVDFSNNFGVVANWNLFTANGSIGAGSVTDINGNVVPGASITLSGINGEMAEQNMATNPTGTIFPAGAANDGVFDNGTTTLTFSGLSADAYNIYAFGGVAYNASGSPIATGGTVLNMTVGPDTLSTTYAAMYDTGTDTIITPLPLTLLDVAPTAGSISIDFFNDVNNGGFFGINGVVIEEAVVAIPEPHTNLIWFLVGLSAVSYWTWRGRGGLCR